MPFKINVSDKGKTAKFEIENEELVGTKIRDKIDGKLISPELKDYELEITGTSDKAGFPGLPDVSGGNLKKVLLTRGRGMWNKKKGLRLRKTVRGNEISTDTVQINAKVVKQGGKKFDDLLPKKEVKEETKEDVEEKKEES